MKRRTIRLREDEYQALQLLARRQRRDLRDQAATLIREGLERQGYLNTERGAQHATPVDLGDDAAESTQRAESTIIAAWRGGTASRAG